MELTEALGKILSHFQLGLQGFLPHKLPDPYPATLFHDTAQAGLSGIIESGVVWATNVLYLNDSSELLYGLSLVPEILNDLESQENTNPVKLFLLHAHELLDVSALLPDRDSTPFAFVCAPIY